MFINSIFGFLVPISAHVSGSSTSNFLQINYFIHLVGSWLADSREVHSRLGRRPDRALHSRIAGEMDSTARTIPDGRSCVRRSSVRNNHLNAFIRITCRALVAVDILRLRPDGRRLEFSIFVDRLWGSIVEPKDQRAGEELHQHSAVGKWNGG